jgi:nucleoside-diphosphate-sugar epimerase
MKVILFGATGMIGQGVLRECLLDASVERVLVVGRASTGQTQEKLRELIHANFFDFSSVAAELSGDDACFFCLGVSSAGMTEEAYQRVTYDITMAAAQTLVVQNPAWTTRPCFAWFADRRRLNAD